MKSQQPFESKLPLTGPPQYRSDPNIFPNSSNTMITRPPALALNSLNSMPPPLPPIPITTLTERNNPPTRVDSFVPHVKTQST